MKKRVVSLLLCLIMALSLIPTAAFAVDTSSQDDGIGLFSIVRPDEKHYYTYQFYLSSDSSEPYSTQIVKEGEKLYQPATPTTEAGKVFTGWVYENGNPFTGFGTVGEIAKSDTIKLYAKIEDGYYVFFKKTDGTVIDTKTGTTGTEISLNSVSFPVEADQAITGWYTDKGLTTPATDPMTIGTSNISLYAKVEKGHWITFDSDGGSYVEPKFFATSVSTTEPNDPAKPGYTFAGWYSGDTKYSFGSPLTESITLKATWTAKENVKYTVIHWQENANDDGYSLKNTETMTGKVGAQTNAAAKDTKRVEDYNGFTAQTIEQKAIAGDGSTIVNVYYKRNVYVINFYDSNDPHYSCEKEEHEHWWKCYKWNGQLKCGKQEHRHSKDCLAPTHQITAKYGAYIRDQWPGGAWYVSPKGTKAQSSIDVMPLGGTNFYGEQTGYYMQTAKYYTEVLPGDEANGTRKNDGRYYYNEPKYTDTTKYDSTLIVTDEDRYPITGFTCNERLSTKDGQNYNGAKFYYTRNSYKIVFMNNGQEKTVSRKYEQSIADVNYTPIAPEGKEGYEFAGWYDNERCEGKAYDFTGKTMPAQHITLYAKWVAPVHTVTVYDSNRTTVLATLKKAHKSTIDMNREMPEYTLPEGYKFLGWVLLEEDGTPFNFTTEITRDYELYAKIGSMATYKVTYNANGGIGTMTDDTKYAEGATASVMANGFTAPKDKVFLGWSTTANGPVKYYANSQLKITSPMTLYAIWGDQDSTVTLTYNANYGTPPATRTIDNLNNNGLVTLAAATLFTRDGYQFTEWNTQADGSGTPFAAGSAARVDSDEPNVLYAQWEQLTGSITVKKIVNDSDGVAPANFTIKVTGPGTGTNAKTYTDTVTADNSVTFNNLPFGSYTITEDDANVNGYTWTKVFSKETVTIGATNLAEEVTVTNTYEPNTADLTIVKNLNTALPQDMTFKFNVMQGTSALSAAEITIKAGELKGSTTVKDLKIGTSYTVQEDTDSAKVLGYTLTAPDAQKVTVTANGAQVEFVNNYTKDTTSVTVTKKWDLNGISEAQRPTKVTVQLMQGNKAYGEPVDLFATNEWTHTWTGLDVYNATGSAIKYTVKEVNVPEGFTAEVKSVATADHPTFTITNAANVADEAEVIPASLTVIKTDAKDGKTLLAGAQFVLIREGAVATESPIVTTGKDGKAVFENLTAGKYTLKEVTAPEGYQATDMTWTITVSDDAQTAGYELKDGKFVKTVTCKVDDVKDVVTNGSITITNAKATGTVTINKVLKGLNATDFTNGFAFDIKDADGNVVATVDKVFPNAAQPATVTLVPGTYTIVEKNADVKDYDLVTEYDKQTFTVEADKNVTVTVTNTYTKKVTPPPAEYTLSVDIQKNIELKRSSSRKPGKASFTFEAYLVDGNGKETILDTVTIDTKGTKSADGKLTFTLTDNDLSVTGHGTVYVREVKGDTRGWTYDDTVYALGVELTDGKLSIISVDTKHIDKPATLEFTNVYYKRSTTTGGDDKPIKSVKTGDMGIAMYAMTSLLSLGGAALVIKKRKDEK